MRKIYNFLSDIFDFMYTYEYHKHRLCWIFESRNVRLQLILALVAFTIRHRLSLGALFASWLIGVFIWGLCIGITSFVYDIDLTQVLNDKDKEIEEAYWAKFKDED